MEEGVAARRQVNQVKCSLYNLLCFVIKYKYIERKHQILLCHVLRDFSEIPENQEVHNTVIGRLIAFKLSGRSSTETLKSEFAAVKSTIHEWNRFSLEDDEILYWKSGLTEL